jgi:hypothetical protein
MIPTKDDLNLKKVQFSRCHYYSTGKDILVKEIVRSSF